MLNSQQWQTYILNQKNSSIYQHRAWNRVLEESLGYQSDPVLVRENNNIAGLLPFFKHKQSLETMPFGDWIAILGDKQLLKKQILAKSENNSIKLVSDEPLMEGQLASDFIDFELKITNYELIRQNSYHKKTRNMVSKAVREGIKVDMVENIDSFYLLYLQTMRKLGALPIPERVFGLAIKYLKQESIIFQAQYQTKIVGYLWVFEFKKTIWVWQNVADQTFIGKGINYALYDKMIQWACTRSNLKLIRFGSSHKDSSQAFFKIRWGAIEKAIFMWPEKQGQAINQKIAMILGKMPLCMLKLVGEIGYKLR